MSLFFNKIIPRALRRHLKNIYTKICKILIVFIEIFVLFLLVKGIGGSMVKRYVSFLLMSLDSP